MFYLIMNVFPYSGFMALHLLNGELQEENDGNDNDMQHRVLYVTAAAIGPYAGLLASSFRLGRIPTAIPWGWCADVYGRKFILIIGILAMIAGNLLFALAPTFLAAVGIRFCTGLLNGTMVVVRTSISEIAREDPKLESRGVAMLSGVSGYAMLIGPAIGGLLSNPVRQYPNYFDKNNAGGGAMRLFFKNVLKDYPFLLPNLIGSIVAILSLLLVVFCVEETLPDDQRADWRLIPMDIGSWIASRSVFAKTKQNSFAEVPQHHEIPTFDKRSTSTSLNSTDIATTNERTPLAPLNNRAEMSPARIGSSKTVCISSNAKDESRNKSLELGERNDEKSTLGSFLDSTSNVRFFFYSMWLYAFSSLASLETFPLFAMTSIAKGGLGLDETGIGIVQTIGGCIFIVGQYTAFSTAIRKLGLMKALRFSTFCRIFLVLFFPLSLYFSPLDTGECGIEIKVNTTITNNYQNCINGKNWYQLGYLGLITGVISILGSIFMGCSTICVNACIDDASKRASMNGLQSMVASLGRGLGPIVAGYLVAVTMTSGSIPAMASAWVVYGVLMIIEAITHLSTRIIPDNTTCSIAKNEKENEKGCSSDSAVEV